MSCYMCGERFCDGHSPAEIESGRAHPDNTNIGDFNKASTVHDPREHLAVITPSGIKLTLQDMGVDLDGNQLWREVQERQQT